MQYIVHILTFPQRFKKVFVLFLKNQNLNEPLKFLQNST